MSPEDKPAEEAPRTDHKPVPAWIKVMWLFAVIWIVTYMVLGLRSTPTGW